MDQAQAAAQEAEYLFQQEVLRQYDTAGNLTSTLAKIINPASSEDPIEAARNIRYFEEEFTVIRDALFEKLGKLEPGSYTNDDLMLVMRMVNSTQASLKHQGVLSKIIPLESFEKGIAANYGPGSTDPNRILIGASVGMSGLTNHLSPLQVGTMCGLKYVGSPYYAFEQIPKTGKDARPGETVDDVTKMLAATPIMARVDIPISDEERDRLRIPMDPIVVQNIISLKNTDPLGEPDPKKRAMLQAAVQLAREFLVKNADKITLVPRKTAIGGTVPSTALKAMENVTAIYPNIPIGKSAGLEPPYTGHTAPGEFGASDYTCIGTEFFIPRSRTPSEDQAFSMRNGTQIVLITNRPGSDPTDRHKPAGKMTSVMVFEEGKWNATIPVDEYRALCDESFAETRRTYEKAPEFNIEQWEKRIHASTATLRAMKYVGPPEELKHYLPKAQRQLPPHPNRPRTAQEADGKKPRSARRKRSAAGHR